MLARFAAFVRRAVVITGGHRAIIFGFLPQNLKTMAVTVPFSMSWLSGAVEDGAGRERARGLLAGFRRELRGCLTGRGDVLSELADAVLCKQDRVHMLAELSLEPECRRGHGAVYDALNCGQVQAGRLRPWRAGVVPALFPMERGRAGVVAEMAPGGGSRRVVVCWRVAGRVAESCRVSGGGLSWAESCRAGPGGLPGGWRRVAGCRKVVVCGAGSCRAGQGDFSSYGVF